jgi:cbb3-type cytochrome oxidase cytochrome c subunit
VEKARERKGPDLFYAGVKYREAWLVKWLQDPARIRPAGYKYWEHIKPRADGPDKVDAAALEKHPKLAADDAKTAAKALMALKANESAVKKNALTPDEVDSFMAEMNFDKFSGCLACHQIEPGYGGFSGPEVYTVGERLQPDFIYSYLKSPQAFDPKGWMPDKQLGENNLQTLTKYMIGLLKEGEK